MYCYAHRLEAMSRRYMLDPSTCVCVNSGLGIWRVAAEENTYITSPDIGECECGETKGRCAHVLIVERVIRSSASLGTSQSAISTLYDIERVSQGPDNRNEDVKTNILSTIRELYEKVRYLQLHVVNTIMIALTYEISHQPAASYYL